ncbi:MAG: cytidylate kinase-like family protein [Eubacterium sp.]|nr:cytidylate kinase-like family protein [Eubacterium sp.]
MRCKYLTIEREYGSGGTKIARLLARQMGIFCYGQEILEEVSKEKDTSVEKIQYYEETVTNSFLYSIYMISQITSGKSDMLTQEGQIYVAEQAVIRRLAANKPAIFLGHCASEALKEYEGVVNVFIRCTNEEAKRRRIVDEYKIPEAQADLIRRKFDRKRANYYSVNTGKKWDQLRNYDLVLDSGKLGEDACVNILKSLLHPSALEEES